MQDQKSVRYNLETNNATEQGTLRLNNTTCKTKNKPMVVGIIIVCKEDNYQIYVALFRDE